MDFKEKIVLVTGASRGLGAVIGYEFAKLGATVVINYNKSEKEALKLKKRIFDDFKKEALVLKADISNEIEVKKMVEKIVFKYGKIDILVNNAGISNDSLFDDKSCLDFNRVLEVNVTGTYLVTKYVGKEMLKCGKGKIINIASDNGLYNYYPESADYDASKAGVISLTHNIAKFYAPCINVNCVCPGWILTDMNKELDDEQKEKLCKKILMKRFGELTEISNVVLFLASDLASYVNDSVIVVNGGYDNE